MVSCSGLGSHPRYIPSVPRIGSGEQLMTESLNVTRNSNYSNIHKYILVIFDETNLRTRKPTYFFVCMYIRFI